MHPLRKIRRIACLGSGFVGGPTSAVIAFKADVIVTVVDLDENRIAAWNSDDLPIYEPGLQIIIAAARDGINVSDTAMVAQLDGSLVKRPSALRGREQPNLSFSTDITTAIDDADLIFLCVNTPTKNTGVGKGAGTDLSFVETATRMIAKTAKQDKIVVEKSTVPCRTAQAVHEILTANARPGVRFDVLSNPEFLAEGTAIRNLLYPDRVIIGSRCTQSGQRAAAMLADVYAQWVPRQRIITMDLWSSELSKLASNAMLAQRISSVNALSAICEATGADVGQKDIFNIIYLSESLHLYEVADYWRAIVNMNEYQKRRITQRVISALYNNLTSKKIGILGFAFKKDTSDTRESPGITLVSNFMVEGAQIAIYDPKVRKSQIWEELVNADATIAGRRLQINVCQDAYDACADADAVVVVTEWDEFSNIDPVKPTADDSPRTALAEQDPNRGPSGRSPSFEPESHTLQEHRLANDDLHADSHTAAIACMEVQLAKAIQGDSANVSRRLDWARIAQGMKKPMFVFDGRNILDIPKLEKLGFRVEAVGRAASAACAKW